MLKTTVEEFVKYIVLVTDVRFNSKLVVGYTKLLVFTVDVEGIREMFVDASSPPVAFGETVDKITEDNDVVFLIARLVDGNTREIFVDISGPLVAFGDTVDRVTDKTDVFPTSELACDVAGEGKTIYKV